MNSKNIDHIYRDGRHYDRLFGPPNMPFWLEMAREIGDPILELGCGTGKITIPLAEAGFDVVGLDLSEAMLKEARRKIEKKELPARWVQADMTAFSLSQKFNTILLPSNNLCHLLRLEEVENCFSCVKEHLLDGGYFVIDVFVPSVKILAQDPSHEEILSEYDDPDGSGKVTITTISTYEPNTQIRRNVTRQKSSGRPDVIGHLDMRMFFPQEIDALLKYNGFCIQNKYGDYNRNEFSNESAKQLIVASVV